jgi:hypothetical protein
LLSAMILVCGSLGGIPAVQAGQRSLADPLETFVVEIQKTSDEALKAHEKDVCRMALDAIRSIQYVRVVSDARIAFETGSQVIPEIGINGMLVGPSRIKVVVDVSRPDWLDSLRSHLPYLLAHEICHMIRIRHFTSAVDPTVPPPPGREAEWDAAFKCWMRGRPPTLGDLVIHEGFADHFAMEVTGEGPSPWDKALDPKQLEHWTQYVLDHWDDSDYDMRAWINGTADMPRQVAYAVGFHLVSNYMSAHDGVRPSQMMLAPAATFKPSE